MNEVLATPVLGFDHLPVISGLQSLGLKFLGFAFVTWLGVEAWKGARTGACDLITPCVRVCFAAVMLQALPEMGNALYGLAIDLSRGVGDETHRQVFAGAISNVSKAAASSGVLDTVLGYVVMSFMVMLTVVKMFVVDLLFPAMFGIVLVMGLLGIPLGAFPGIDSTKGWVMALLEISLWPVCYQLVVAMLASQWADMLEEISKADFSGFFSDMAQLIGQDNAAESFTASHYFLLVKFCAFLVLYGVLTLFSPAIAAVILRSQPAGYVGGIMAAKGGKLLSAGVSQVGKRLGKMGGGSSSPFKSGIADTISKFGSSGKSPRDSLKDMNKREGARPPRRKGA